MCRSLFRDQDSSELLVVFTSISHCLNSCSSRISLKSSGSKFLNVIFFKIFCYTRSFKFSYKFWNQFINIFLFYLCFQLYWDIIDIQNNNVLKVQNVMFYCNIYCEMILIRSWLTFTAHRVTFVVVENTKVLLSQWISMI